jgi:hypothetical protein
MGGEGGGDWPDVHASTDEHHGWNANFGLGSAPQEYFAFELERQDRRHECEDKRE